MGVYPKKGLYINIENLRDFHKRVGTVVLTADLPEMVQLTWGTTASFFPHEISEICTFCTRNSQYHIVSVIDDFVYANRYVENSKLYYLADGDCTPLLIHNSFFSKDRHLHQEELQDKVATILHNLNRCI